jgi:hypothetical protein
VTTMRSRRWPSILALAMLLLPAIARAQAPDMTGTTLVSIKGTLVADEKTADDVGWGGISLGFTGSDASKTRWLGVVHATAFGGDSFDAKTAVFQAHYNPTLIVAGPPELAKQLQAMPNGTRVQLEGAVLLGSRNIMLDLVRKLPPK